MPWYRTLFFRVVVLCAVVVLCLLAALAAVTRHFFQEAAAEMEARSADIAHSLEFRFEQGFQGDYRTLENDLMDLNKGVDIKIEDEPDSKRGASFIMERLPDGSFVRVARVPLINDGRHVLMTATVTIVPQTEILRAFQNKYMLAVLAVFFGRAGHDGLGHLEGASSLAAAFESCAAISASTISKTSARAARRAKFWRSKPHSTAWSTRCARRRRSRRGSARRSGSRRWARSRPHAAHDVRNPLNAIKLLSSHAIDLVDGGAEAPAARLLQDHPHRGGAAGGDRVGVPVAGAGERDSPRAD